MATNFYLMTEWILFISFLREVEYSEDNLETLAEEFIFDDIFKSENIIKLFNFSY